MPLLQRIEEAEYHALPRFGYSNVKEFLRSPAHWLWRKAHPKEPTGPMLLGTAADMATFEPSRFDTEYGVLPDVSLATKEGKAAKQALLEAGKTPIKPDDYAACCLMRDALWSHPDVRDLLGAEDAEAQGSILFDVAGLPAKARPDLVVPSLGIVADLKTTDDARPEAFARTVESFGYDVQAYHYSQALMSVAPNVNWIWLWIVIERDGPNAIRVYQASPEHIESGFGKVALCAQRYRECVESGIWPAYAEGIEILSRPKWAVKGEGDE